MKICSTPSVPSCNYAHKVTSLKSPASGISFRSNNAFTKLIKGQENCWRLHKEGFFEEFVRSDSELKVLANRLLERLNFYGLSLTIPIVLNFRKEILDLDVMVEKIKSKYEIDITIPPLVYRFIGSEEKQKLEAGETVSPQRIFKAFDVTINPNLNWNIYRVTFKPLPKCSILDKNSLMKENPGCNHDYFYHYKESYSLADVEKIETVER
jgi:hypothetical protein